MNDEDWMKQRKRGPRGAAPSGSFSAWDGLGGCAFGADLGPSFQFGRAEVVHMLTELMSIQSVLSEILRDGLRNFVSDLHGPFVGQSDWGSFVVRIPKPSLFEPRYPVTLDVRCGSTPPVLHCYRRRKGRFVHRYVGLG